jgi:MFS family permease
MIGLEQTVVPLIGANEFDIQSNALIVSFIASFGLVKAFLNLFAGKISDKWGRKNVLILGWLFGIPVPIILILAPDWNWVIIANVFLGINQGLAWSMTVNMKIDLVGKEKRGFALGFNEFSGYFAVAIVGFITGYIASVYGLKPYPFYLGIIFAVLGLLISWLIVKDTRKFTLLEIETQDKSKPVDENNVEMNGNLKFVQVFLQTSWKNRSLLAISQAGLVNNLIFGVSWGLFTLYFSSYGLSANDIGFLKALHPGIWGVLQLATGFLSDKIGRKILIFPGMFIQSIGVWTILYSQEAWAGL